MGRGRERVEESKPKIGAGWAKAALRQGAKEVAQVLPAFPAHGIQPVEEPGTPGNLTPQEVDRDKQKDTQIEPGD